MTPYVAATFLVRDGHGRARLSVELEDDQAGLARISEVNSADEDEHTVLVDTDHIPALIQALRMVQRDNRRVRREEG